MNNSTMRGPVASLYVIEVVLYSSFASRTKGLIITAISVKNRVIIEKSLNLQIDLPEGSFQ